MIERGPVDDDDGFTIELGAEAKLPVEAAARRRSTGEDRRLQLGVEVDEIRIVPGLGIGRRVPDFDAAIFGHVVVREAEQRAREDVRGRVKTRSRGTLPLVGVQPSRDLRQDAGNDKHNLQLFGAQIERQQWKHDTTRDMYR